MERNKLTLQQAQQYEDKMLEKTIAHEKPHFHFCAPIGWINDSNGFSLYKGQYHLFYQYHPYSIKWGPMHWGHAKTNDFIKWERLPIALAPDENYDEAGCFSGSAFEDDGKHVIAYTSVSEYVDHDETVVRQTQSIAVGDGIKYVKQSGNPVIDSSMIPENCSREDFRDPKIWKENGKYYMLVANRKVDGHGQILKYSSDNLREWSYVGVFFSTCERIGNMWECPDYFEMDEKKILLISPQDMMAQELKCHSGNASIYITTGKDNETFIPQEMNVLDYGIDFYAPQTLLTSDGRRVMIAWMQTWDVETYPEDFEWHGMMTLPRELRLSQGKIFQNPVKEIEKYWENIVSYKNTQISGEMQLEGIAGRCMDLAVNITKMECDILEIQLAKKEENYISIELDRNRNRLIFSRRYSQCIRDVVNERSVDLDCGQKEISLRIIMDLYSVEIFINQGEKNITSLFFIDKSFREVMFKTSKGHCVLDVEKRDVQL